MTSGWLPMIWVGGTPGAGKSRFAWRLAHEHDLPLLAVDAFTYAHDARLRDQPPLDDVLAQGPEAAADAFQDAAGRRLALVLAELRSRSLGGVTTVVEGPQLDPDLAGPLPTGHGVWLLTTADRTRRVRHARRPESPSRVDALVARDAVLRERIGRRAAELGRPVVQVPVDPDWDAVRTEAAEALRPGLESGRPLGTAAARTAARRWENDAAHRQLVAHLRASGLTTSWPFPFACECGRSGCAAVWEGRPEEYATAASVTAPGHG